MSSRDELTEEQVTVASSTNTNTNASHNLPMQSSYPCEPPAQPMIHTAHTSTTATSPLTTNFTSATTTTAAAKDAMPPPAGALALVPQDVTFSTAATTTTTMTTAGANERKAEKQQEEEEGAQRQLVQSAANDAKDNSKQQQITNKSEGEDDAHFLAVERAARDVLERIATREEDVELHMGEYVAALQAYRALCQGRAMYKEAHLLHQVLRHLRLEEETRHVRGLTEQQMQARRALEEQHKSLFKAFHQRWNEQIDAFEEQQLEQEAALLERQNNELAAFHEEMRGFNPRILRYSRTLIHTRTKQFTLAKQREYLQAQTEKIKGDAQEEVDLQKFAGVKTTMYERREAALLHRHEQEMVALRMKIEGRRHYLERMRQRELDELLQRYINARRELECQQNIIRSKTTTVLMKHACNTKTDTSASAMLIASAASGTFGTSVQRRLAAESYNTTMNSTTSQANHRLDGTGNAYITTTTTTTTTTGHGIEGAAANTGSAEDTARVPSRHQLLLDALYPTTKSATTLTAEL